MPPGLLIVAAGTNALVLYFALAIPDNRSSWRSAYPAAQRQKAICGRRFCRRALWRADADTAALAYIEKKWGRLLARTDGHGVRRPGRWPRTWTGELAGGARARSCAQGRGILEIRPQLSGLERAEGVVPTPHGDVEVAWGAYGGDFSARLSVPHDGETHLSVPRCDKRFPQIEINGETVWRNEKAHPNFHVQELISQEERVVMVLRRAGQYEVSVE